MKSEIYEYCLKRKPKGSDTPTWQELMVEIEDRFGFRVNSPSGLRSRISEYRRNKEGLLTYVPGKGLIIPRSEGWGDGLAQLVKISTTETFEVVAFLSDIHVPYHNAALLASVMALLKDLQPHVVVINGDVSDFFQLSRFNKAHAREDELQQEIDQANDIRAMIRDACPNAILRETLGNHDERIITYVEINSKALHSLRALKPEELFHYNKLDIEHYPRSGFRLRPEFVVEHGHVVRKDSGASAKSRLNDTMISGIMGHTHRMGDAHRTGYRKLSWFEQGCLCMQEPDYVIGEANWQPGIAIGHFHTTMFDIFNVQLVKALGDSLIFDGKVYGQIETKESVNV